MNMIREIYYPMKETLKNNDDYDKRHPYYKGFWKRSIPYRDEGFAIDGEYEQPHNKRRIIILQKHPKIKELFGPSSKTKYVIYGKAIAHIFGMYAASKISNAYLFIFLCYFWGATLTALAGITIHECTHMLAAHTVFGNYFLGLIANLPILIPISASFAKYHLKHHTSLGVIGSDPDLPLDIEYKLVRGNWAFKIIYIFTYPFLYLVRSTKVENVSICKEEVLNAIFHFSCLFISYKVFGVKALYYLTLSTYFGYSIHPCAAHLIQEHFTFSDGQETTSYYGPLNKLFLNIGYHVEHHDFANVPWDKLPRVKEESPEFYSLFDTQKSWFGVFYRFITEETMGPQSRVARTKETHKKGMEKRMPLQEKNKNI